MKMKIHLLFHCQIPEREDQYTQDQCFLEWEMAEWEMAEWETVV